MRIHEIILAVLISVAFLPDAPAMASSHGPTEGDSGANPVCSTSGVPATPGSV